MPFQYHDILQNDNQSQGLNTEFKTQLVLHNNLMNLDIWKIERSETVMTTSNKLIQCKKVNMLGDTSVLNVAVYLALVFLLGLGAL